MKKIKSAFAAAFLLGLANCSHKSAEADRVMSAPDSRDAYVQYVDKRLSRLEADTNKLNEPGRRRIESSIKDARIELSQLQNSTSSNWRSYRSRLDGALAKIERDQDQRRLE